MPAVVRFLGEEARAEDDDDGLIENEKIWFPSDLPKPVRMRGCFSGLVAMEDSLREAQCRDALERIRCLERAKLAMVQFRHNNIRGQKQLTRSKSSFEVLQDRTKRAVAKYRRAREALLALRGPGEWESMLRLLKDADVCSPGNHEFDIEDPNDPFGADGRLKPKKRGSAQEKKIAAAQQKNRSITGERLGEGTRIISWIWTVPGALGNGDDGALNEGILSTLKETSVLTFRFC